MTHIALGSAALVAVGCSDDPTGGPGPAGGDSAHVLYVGHEGSLSSYDIATGKERPGAVQDVVTPVDMQALDDATLLVNLTDRNEILVVDGKTMLETKRIPASSGKATRPVHSYLTPERDGKQYWMSLNDGDEGKVETDSATFVDVTKGSASYLTPVGEVGLGIGHHKAAFSHTQNRVVISNIADCDNVMSVYDYSDLSDIKTLATLTGKDAGFDGATPETTCDPTYQMGAPPAPHGCATSKVSGKAYCNLTTSGDIVVIDLDAEKPTFSLVHTGGSGAGYTKATLDGQYIFSLQGSPREKSEFGPPGPTCQIGQLVVIDASTEKVVKELPLGYTGPACDKKLTGTDEETTEAGHMQITHDGKTLFVTLAGGFGVDSARVREEVVVDISDPKAAVQLPSIPTGTSVSYAGDCLCGDSSHLFVTNNIDGSVTRIDPATRKVTATIETHPTPKVLATFGEEHGPSVQTGPIH